MSELLLDDLQPTEASSKIMRGLEEAKSYIEGEREGYKVTVPPSVAGKSIDELPLRGV